MEQAFKSLLRQKITILFHCSKVFFIFRSYITLVKPMLCKPKVFSIFYGTMEQSYNKMLIIGKKACSKVCSKVIFYGTLWNKKRVHKALFLSFVYPLYAIYI